MAVHMLGAVQGEGGWVSTPERSLLSCPHPLQERQATATISAQPEATAKLLAAYRVSTGHVYG